MGRDLLGRDQSAGGRRKKLVERAEWDEEWNALPTEVRDTILAMAEHGLRTSGGLYQRKAEIPPWVVDVYETFYLIDRDGFTGAVTFAGMLQALDWMEVREKPEQRRIMAIWRQMEQARRSARDRLKEAEASGETGPRDPGRAS